MNRDRRAVRRHVAQLKKNCKNRDLTWVASASGAAGDWAYDSRKI
jgi:hypothetical protein